MALYKYMKSEHAEMFFRNGTLRIGTLLDFKKNEAFNEAVGDKHEGSHYPYSIIDEPIAFGDMSASQAAFFKGTFDAPPAAIISGIRLTREISSCDFFVFCMTTEPSRTAMEEFECDTCIEIVNPTLFLRALTRKVRILAGDLVWYGHVTYMDKKYPYTLETGLHPASTKDEKYIYQKEYRAIWQGKKYALEDGFLSPIFVKVPKSIKFCRKIRI